MAKYTDYVKEVQEETVAQDEIQEAAQQQEERETSTPEVDWEKRYADLEVAYSQQGQTMGDYRKLIDDYVSTPVQSQTVEEIVPITSDDIYENPDEAVRRAVDSHPAILQAKQDKVDNDVQKATAIRAAFTVQHPESQATWQSSEFASWVTENPMRGDLAVRANEFDMTAADALFTLWEADQAAQATAEETQANQAVDAVGLESGTATFETAPDRYSRSEMLETRIRAKQGDREAERYVKANAAAYRIALGSGNVRD